jgi:hypothetical protein
LKKNKQDLTPKAPKPLSFAKDNTKMLYFAKLDTEDMSPCAGGKQFGDLLPMQLNKCFSATPGFSK